ncbi:hypothetical protein [Ileibacterium valens]|uniref:hypothetical protein n=2 Tax=Ileibacterium valens TaxID=1862668 RepID=UPI0023535EC0|nr:hypothetical protein [Ileibacterium valens]
MVSEKKKDVAKPWILFALIGLLILFRFLLAAGLGNTINSEAGYDDGWFVNSSYLHSYVTANSAWSMIKSPVYFVFLWFVRKSHIPLWFWSSLLWLAVSGLCWFIMSRLTKNRKILFFGFIFILFCPIAFDYRSGLKIYRSMFMAPWLGLFFESCLLLTMDFWLKKKVPLKSVFWDIGLVSVTYPIAYLSKEDGLWLLAVLIFTVSACLIRIGVEIAEYLRNNRILNDGFSSLLKRNGVLILLLALPFCVSFAANETVRCINEKAFGVRLINSRTEGELAHFASLVYEIDSSKRDSIYWAPNDALFSAIEASPTLKNEPELLKRIYKGSFFDLSKEQIHGDFIPWVILSALADSKTWESGEKTQAFFGQVNDEIEEAFRQGKLKKQEGRFFLTKQAGSRSVEEIFNLWPYMVNTLRGSILLDSYKVTMKPSIDSNSGTFKKAQNTAHEDLFAPANQANQEQLWNNRKIANGIAELIFWIYRIMNPLLLLIGFISWVYLLLNQFRQISGEPKIIYLLSSVFCMIGIWIAYVFVVSWFSEFIFIEDGLDDWARSILTFYTAGGITLQYLTEVFSVLLVFEFFKKLKSTRPLNP